MKCELTHLSHLKETKRTKKHNRNQTKQTIHLAGVKHTSQGNYLWFGCFSFVLNIHNKVVYFELNLKLLPTNAHNFSSAGISFFFFFFFCQHFLLFYFFVCCLEWVIVNSFNPSIEMFCLTFKNVIFFSLSSIFF